MYVKSDSVKDFIQEVGIDLHHYHLKTLCETFKLLVNYREMNIYDIYREYKNREDSEDGKLEAEIFRTESPELIRQYYSSTVMYLYELNLHEASNRYLKLFDSILKFAQSEKCQKILDWGGGIGGLTMHLRKNGFVCDYLDIPGNTWRYAKYCFEKNGIKEVNMIPAEQSDEIYNSYDMIVTLDCLEHLHPLGDYLEKMFEVLKPSGILLSMSTFRGEGLHIKSNHQYNDLEKFNRLARSAGFSFKGFLSSKFGLNILVPPLVLRLIGIKEISGRKAVHVKN